MPSQTTRALFPYPLPPEPVALGADNIKALADDLDAKVSRLLWDSQTAGVVLPAVSITTPTLSALYRSLRIEAVLRSDRNAAAEQLNCQFNGDGAGNYDLQLVQTFGTTSTPSDGFGSTQGIFGYFAAALSAGNVGILTAKLPGYAVVGFAHNMLSETFHKSSQVAGGLQLTKAGVVYRGLSALSTIRFFTANGSNFVAPTRIQVYGEA